MLKFGFIFSFEIFKSLSITKFNFNIINFIQTDDENHTLKIFLEKSFPELKIFFDGALFDKPHSFRFAFEIKYKDHFCYKEKENNVI